MSGNENYEKVDKNGSKLSDWKPLDHIIWWNIVYYIVFHLATLYGVYLCFTEAKIATLVFALILYHLSQFGITAGAHRLWSHRAYKANLPFRILLGICNSISFQKSIFGWVREHRTHHKFTETDADPVNSKRGFFFCHIGWQFCAKHPDVKRLGARVDFSDIWADPVVAFQYKYYESSVILLCFALPTLIPWYYWNESVVTAFFVCGIMRYILSLNATFLVNSAAHMWGYRPFDAKIAPAENISVSAITLGEGFHNYHHVFPWDYSHSELGWTLNLTTFILDQFATIGWVYDRRKASKEQIESRKLRTGSKCNEYEEHEDTYGY